MAVAGAIIADRKVMVAEDIFRSLDPDAKSQLNYDLERYAREKDCLIVQTSTEKEHPLSHEVLLLGPSEHFGHTSGYTRITNHRLRYGVTQVHQHDNFVNPEQLKRNSSFWTMSNTALVDHTEKGQRYHVLERFSIVPCSIVGFDPHSVNNGINQKIETHPTEWHFEKLAKISPELEMDTPLFTAGEILQVLNTFQTRNLLPPESVLKSSGTTPKDWIDLKRALELAQRSYTVTRPSFFRVLPLSPFFERFASLPPSTQEETFLTNDRSSLT